MKISVLLPTRNGGPYLDACIRSVLAQPSQNLQLVVSDNANTDETADVLRGFSGDTRLVVVRQERPIAVTDNWIAALEASTGDHILMLGDDDYLMPNAIGLIEKAYAAAGQPECLSFNGLSYVFPSAIHGLTISHYADPHFRYPDVWADGAVLDASDRFTIVKDMFRFRPRIPLNMQTTLVARAAAQRLPDGRLFRAPFPDHYALNALLLTVSSWAISPIKPIVVGVSPKSFGHFVYSSQQAAGLTYLGIDTEFPGRLPGNELINASVVWLRLLKATFPEQLREVEVSRGDYVARQIAAWLREVRAGSLPPGDAIRRARHLRAPDLMATVRLARDRELACDVNRLLRLAPGDRAGNVWKGLVAIPTVKDIAEFAAWAAARAA